MSRSATASGDSQAESGLTTGHIYWLDGEWITAPPKLQLSCYTTGLFKARKIRHGTELALRLSRDAAALGLGSLKTEDCVEAMHRIGERAFGTSTGIVRIDAAKGEHGEVQLLGRFRRLDRGGGFWTAATFHEFHQGDNGTAGAKLSHSPIIERARAHIRKGPIDEVLIANSAGHLIEGSKTNLFVLTKEGYFITPPLHSGPVRGVARQILLEKDPHVIEGDVTIDLLENSLEVVVANAVRGAIPVVKIDGKPAGTGKVGRGALRLAKILDSTV